MTQAPVPNHILAGCRVLPNVYSPSHRFPFLALPFFLSFFLPRRTWRVPARTRPLPQ
jgi:hypothetical protein